MGIWSDSFSDNNSFSDNKQKEEQAVDQPEGKGMDKDAAVEFSIMIAMMSTTGIDRSDTMAFRNTLIKTFTTMLDGLGYTVVKKEL